MISNKTVTRELKVNDPVRIIGNDFQTSIGLVREGSIGRVLGFVFDKVPDEEEQVRVHVEVYGPAVNLYLLERFVEYHRPPPSAQQHLPFGD